MGCLAPIVIRDKRDLNLYGGTCYMQVPCGKCYNCLRRMQLDWSIRLIEQLRHSPLACFITLTYRDSSVPYSFDSVSGESRMSLCKHDYQTWLKMLRYDCSRDGVGFPVSYLICGEYGSRNFRPHYHIVVIGRTSDQLRISLDRWRADFGFVLAEDIGCTEKDKSCVGMYVGKYSTKSVLMGRSPLLLPFMEKPFILSSHNFGASWIDERIDYFSFVGEHSRYSSFEDFCEDFSNTFYYPLGNFRCSIPRYYRDRFFKSLDSSFFEDIVNRTDDNCKTAFIDKKIVYVKSPKNGVTCQVPVVVPSLRNSLALGISRFNDDLYRRKCESPSGEFSCYMACELAREEFSSSLSASKDSERKIHDFINRSSH